MKEYATAAARTSESAPTHLLADLRDNPLGIATALPSLSWEDPLLPGGTGWQHSYEIRISQSDRSGAFNNTQGFISTDWVTSSSSTSIPWPFAPLEPLQSVMWQVRVRMTSNIKSQTRTSEWSEPQIILRGPESISLWKKAQPIWSAHGTPITAAEPGPTKCTDGTLTVTLSRSVNLSSLMSVSSASLPSFSLLARSAPDGNDGFVWTIDFPHQRVSFSRKINGVLSQISSSELTLKQLAEPSFPTIRLQCCQNNATLWINNTPCLTTDKFGDAGGFWGLQTESHPLTLQNLSVYSINGECLTHADATDSSSDIPWFAHLGKDETEDSIIIPAHTTGMLGEPGAGDYWSLLRKTFDLPEIPITRAYLFTTGSNPSGARQYVYRANINGTETGVGPSRSSTGLLYETHDVGKLLHPGCNIISALCWAQTGGFFRALLLITFADGSSRLIGTDDTWQGRSGERWRPWSSDLNHGVHYYVAPREDIDSRYEPIGWQTATDWTIADLHRYRFSPVLIRSITTHDYPHADPSSPLVAYFRKPHVIQHIRPTRWLIDVGTESAYAVVLDLNSAVQTQNQSSLSGLRLRLRMGEQLENQQQGLYALKRSVVCVLKIYGPLMVLLSI